MNSEIVGISETLVIREEFVEPVLERRDFFLVGSSL